MTRKKICKRILVELVLVTMLITLTCCISTTDKHNSTTETRAEDVSILTEKTNEDESSFIDNVDLCEILLSEDEIREEDNFTLVRDEKVFYVYQNEKVIKEITFLGGNIINDVFNDGYIVDSNNDLYYCYYNNDVNNFEMRFIKVASDIDEIVQDNAEFIFHTEFDDYSAEYTMFEDTKLYFPIYKKEGKLFVTYANVWEECFYSCNRSNIKDERPNDSTGYLGDIETITYDFNNAVISYSELRIDETGITTNAVNIYNYYVFDKNINIKYIEHIYDAHTDELPDDILKLNYKILTENEKIFITDFYKNINKI